MVPNTSTYSMVSIKHLLQHISLQSVISGKEGNVPCQGHRSSQLVYWDEDEGTNNETHICNGVLECMDRSDETDVICKDSTSVVNDGIKEKVREISLSNLPSFYTVCMGGPGCASLMLRYRCRHCIHRSLQK